VLLDRDGTVNEEVCYLSRPEQLRLIGRAAEAIGLLNRAGCKVVIFTNQAGVARGMFDERQLGAVHASLRAMLAEHGARLDAIYYCPHHPEHGVGRYKVECSCRKPKPGMLRQAARDHQLDLARSFVVGDKTIDVEAGQAAGCRTVLVRTGYGAEAEKSIDRLPGPPTLIADDLWQAAQWILQQSR
jgi:D-glycero-D-manno-heptose 1,7-bisphosphate phosphatase